MAPLPTSSGPRIRTSKERRTAESHLLPASLSRRLKAGLVTAPSYRPVYSKILGDQHLATQHVTRLGERELYRQLLQARVGVLLPSSPSSRPLLPSPPRSSPVLATPAQEPAPPLTSTLAKTQERAGAATFGALGASPVFGRAGPGGSKQTPRSTVVVEEVRRKEVASPRPLSREEEELCSPDFLAGLRERWRKNDTEFATPTFQV